ncbi:mechanosensitive ion channel family protein [Roseovarius sp. M141]|nr:mechanosensitive ion channel family protein [Roseovarius sp. M141]
MLRHLLLALTLALLPGAATLSLTATTAAAQQPPSSPDYDRWDTISQRAITAIENQRASTSAFESLRDQLAEWRSVFSAAQSINSNAIATLDAQVRAFGPAPAEGEPGEGAEIASQRESLTKKLAELRAPVKRAELAYSKADEMIKSIDRIVRERTAEELLERGPSPLNPQHWPIGVHAIVSTFEDVRNELAVGLSSTAQRADLWSRMPVTALMGLVGLVLLLRGRFWAELLVRIAMPQAATSGRWLISFLMSLGGIIVPFIGLMILIKAFAISGLFAARSNDMLQVLQVSVLIFLVARWQALRCFPRGDGGQLPLDLTPEQRRSGRLYGGAMGFIITVFHFIYEVGSINGWPAEARAVALFPVMVLAGLLLIRLARLLAHHTRQQPDEQDVEAEGGADTYRNKLGRVLSKLLVIVAVVAPLLAAIGYQKAAVGLLMPSLLSLMLLAALIILQSVIVELYSLATNDRDGAADELIPMLLGFLVALASLPLFALVWGARVSDLSELWVSFRRGITVGDMTISPTIFLTLAIIFAIGFVVTRVTQGMLKTSLLPKTRIDTGGRNAIVSGVGYIGIFLAGLIAVTSAGIDLSSIAIVAGALSVGIGFGLQTIVSNFVSGIILLIERPISQGDWIEVNGQHGTVREISVRSTRIETFDRSDLIIPNSDLISGTVTNYTKGSTVGRVIVKVGVAYGTDTKWVESILREIARAHPMVLMNPEPAIIFHGIGVESFDFEIRAILRDINFIMNVTSDMNHEIAARFAKEGIEMPYQQRDIWLRNPETLTGAMGAARAKPRKPRPASQDTSAMSVDEAQRMDDADGGGGAGDADR